MHLLRVRSLLLVLLAAAGVAAGCGEGTLSSPTGPSPSADVAAVDVDPPDALASLSDDGLTPAGDALEALDRGKGAGGDRDGKDKDQGKPEKDKSDRGKGSSDDDDEDDDDDDVFGRRRNLSGWVTAVGADSITIRGVVVKVTPTTVIRHGNRRLTLAQIEVGDHAQAKGTMSADGHTMTATEIKVEDTGNDNDDDDEDEVKVTGVVAGLTGTCPTLTFTVGGSATVKTDASTEFKDVTCATVANGARVEAKGIRQADGSILAKEVKRLPEEVAGTVSELSGTCPTRTFKLGTTVVKTDVSTKFEGATCAQLSNGTKVEVEGIRQADGSLLAKEVEFDLDELEGAIAELSGTCPSLTFKLGTTTVTTNATTTFSGVACAALANGTRVEVEGALNGTNFAAIKVKLDD